MTVEVLFDERGICTIRLNRPDKRNAIDDDMMRTLVNTLDTLERRRRLA